MMWERDKERGVMVENQVEKPKVVLVDEQHLFRKGLRTALEDAGLIIVGDFCSEEEIYPWMEEMPLDVVAICSLSLPHWNYLVRNLLLRQPGTAVIGIVDQPAENTAREALMEGISLCMSREQPLTEWIAGIIEAWSGQVKPEKTICQHPSLAQYALLYLSQPVGVGTAGSIGPELNTHESQVLRSLSEGIPLSQIADGLGVGVDTVNNVLRSVCKKLVMRRQLQVLLEAVC